MPASRPLDRFPRPNVAVDVAVLTVLPAHDVLAVLVQERTSEAPRGLALPGQFMRPGRTIEQTVADVLTTKVGLTDTSVRPGLLRTSSGPDRDERATWSISVAHTVTLAADRIGQATGDLVPVDASGMLVGGVRLLFDHDAIVEDAVRRIRDRYEAEPDPDDLLPSTFTLAQLRRTHEAVLGAPLRKDSFNRRMREHLVGLEDDGGPVRTSETVGRPAQLFQKTRPAPGSGFDRWRLPRTV